MITFASMDKVFLELSDEFQMNISKLSACDQGMLRRCLSEDKIKFIKLYNLLTSKGNR